MKKRLKGGNSSQDLILASLRGNLNDVIQAINNGADINYRDNRGYTALILASTYGHTEIVRLLLEKDADPNIQNNNGETALMVASTHGRTNIVRLLLENRADPNFKSSDGKTALMIASTHGRTEIVSLLLDNRANPNIQNNNGETALILASSYGRTDIVRLLLEKGANPNIQNKNGETALMFESDKGHTEIVELLLEKGANPNVKNNAGNTALILASRHGHTEIVELLLENRADPNFKSSEDGETALMIASTHGHIDIIHLLLEKGAQPNIQNKNGKTALMIASTHGLINTVRLLLENHADPNIQNNDGETALILASRFRRNIDIVRLLLENRAQPNIQNKNGETTLILASRQGHTEIVKLLLEKGADPNFKSSDGNTALILASSQGHTEIVHLLFENRAQPNIQNNAYNTALMLASRQGHTEIVRLLLEKGADPNIQNNVGNTALMEASREGHSNIVRLLLENRADPNILNNRGETAIQLTRNIAIRNLLTQYGAENRAIFQNIRTSQNTLIIPSNIINPRNQNQNTCNTKLYDFLMKNYTTGIQRFHLQGQTGVNAAGISRAVYDKFATTYYDKNFNKVEVNNNEFMIPKFPITNDMKKATQIMISLCQKTNVKFVVPIPDSLWSILSKTSVHQMKNDFNPKNINATKLGNNISINEINNNYATTFLASNSKENAIRNYIELNEHHLKNNIKWQNLTNSQKRDYYFQNYLNKLEIGTIDNLKELHNWFNTIKPYDIKVNYISYDAESVMSRIKFKYNTRFLFTNNSQNNKNKNEFANAYTLYQFLKDGTDEDRMNFIEFATGTKYSLANISVIVDNREIDKPIVSHTCFNRVDVYKTKEKITPEIIRAIISPENSIHIRD